MDATISFGIVTVSDTCYAKEKEDVAGPKLAQEISRCFPNAKISFTGIVPDSQDEIVKTLRKCISERICDVIFTTGGTGFSPRDVTPEATRSVIEREASNLANAITQKSLQVTDMAMLSRAICGIAQQTIIINLPGSTKGALECFGFVKTVIPHAVALVADKKEEIVKDHKEVQDSSNTANNKQQITQTDGKSKVKVKVGASRNRKSPYPMIEVSAATEIILNECSPTTEVEVVPFEKSLHRVLAEDVKALEPIPPFPASIKDGYAVIASDEAGKRKVVEALAAGDKPGETALASGEAIRISTGAPVPPGATAVVQVEDTTLIKVSDDGETEEIISINVKPSEGQDIRAVGSDIALDTVVFERFECVTSAHIGVLAMLGKTEVKVFKKPCIGILSTGNELRDPREILKPGQIRDSNKVTLMNLLKRYGYVAMDCGVARDSPDSVKSALERAFEKNDIVISSGGVSMGEFDLLKQVLVEDFNALIHFGRVNMKPGKPTTFATLNYHSKVKIVFALPGNPASCSVTSLLFIIPTLRFLERQRNFKFPVTSVKLVEHVENKDVRPDYVRIRIYANESGMLSAYTTGNQISSRLNSMVGANGLAVLPGKSTYRINDFLKSIVIDEI